MTIIAAAAVLAACDTPTSIPAELDAQIAAVNEQHVFADMHAHPSRFHRANVGWIAEEEIDLYRINHMNMFVANVSSDMAFSGNYTNRDGSRIEKGQYKPKPGEAYSLAIDRLMRLRKTMELGYAVHADKPESVIAARENDEVAIMPALEGADALEGNIDNLREMHRLGLRLLQLIHFRNNELGHMQTYPYSPGGLTDFGREVVVEANRLGIVIDLAHANNQTIMEVLELSKHPVIFSHGGVKGIRDRDRAVSDDEIKAIAANGGVIGIWPHGKHIDTVDRMVDYIDYVVEVGGIDHVGIGSDLRGISAYAEGFDEEANFRAIAAELLDRGYSDEETGKVMGGNFFRVWQMASGSDDADTTIDYPKILSNIENALSALSSEFPQLQAFPEKAVINSNGLGLSYSYRTHESDRTGGWTSGVPNPDDDGIWFYIDIHDPNSAAQIHTQPMTLPLCLGSMKVSFLLLEGKNTKTVNAKIFSILKSNGISECRRTK